MVKRREERAKAGQTARHARGVHGLLTIVQVCGIAPRPAARAAVWIFVAQLHAKAQPVPLESVSQPGPRPSRPRAQIKHAIGAGTLDAFAQLRKDVAVGFADAKQDFK